MALVLYLAVSCMQYGTHTRANIPSGWKWVETPGHGYLYPSFADNQRVPAFLRATNYEEDLAYNVPILFNPHLFTQETVEYASKTFRDYNWREYEKAMKVTLQRGESTHKDNDHFLLLDNVGKHLALSVSGEWAFDVPRDNVYIHAVMITKGASYEQLRKSGERKTFLLPTDTYRASESKVFDINELTPYVKSIQYESWEQYPGERYK